MKFKLALFVGLFLVFSSSYSQSSKIKISGSVIDSLSSELLYGVNLLVDDSDEPIKHPLIEEIFSGKKGSSYFKLSN